MSHPRDIATAHTLDFIAFYLGPPPKRVLEVGCGAGDLALALQRLGFEVTAIDSSTEAVRAALRRGVAARACAFAHFSDTTGFEAVLFTRSLHHIAPLDAALAHARHLMRPRAVLLIEDFDWRSPDAATLRWQHGVTRLVTSLTEGAPDEAAFPEDGSLREAWVKDHDPGLHDGPTIDSALRDAFNRVEAGRAPYLYRSAITALADHPHGQATLRGLLQWESRLIEAGALAAVGRRWMATNLVT